MTREYLELLYLPTYLLPIVSRPPPPPQSLQIAGLSLPAWPQTDLTRKAFRHNRREKRLDIRTYYGTQYTGKYMAFGCNHMYAIYT